MFKSFPGLETLIQNPGDFHHLLESLGVTSQISNSLKMPFTYAPERLLLWTCELCPGGGSWEGAARQEVLGWGQSCAAPDRSMKNVCTDVIFLLPSHKFSDGQ